MAFDECLNAFMLGQRLRPGLMGVGIKIIGYSYNGVRLPKLPEYDTTKYKYANIFSYFVNGKLSVTNLYCATSKIYWGYYSTLGVYGQHWSNDGEFIKFSITPDDDTWTRDPTTYKTYANFCFQSNNSNMNWFWFNYDYCTRAGSVLVKASDPIPVYGEE